MSCYQLNNDDQLLPALEGEDIHKKYTHLYFVFRTTANGNSHCNLDLPECCKSLQVCCSSHCCCSSSSCRCFFFFTAVFNLPMEHRPSTNSHQVLLSVAVSCSFLHNLSILFISASKSLIHVFLNLPLFLWDLWWDQWLACSLANQVVHGFYNVTRREALNSIMTVGKISGRNS